jgi:hypothetical protein
MPIRIVEPEERKDSSCSCQQCKEMCRRSPCFPTPEEVEKLIAAGYKQRLKASWWGNLFTREAYSLIAPSQEENGCTFLNGNGLCELHDQGLKPLEGRLASHDMPDHGLRQWVVKKWISEKGLQVLKGFTNDPEDLLLIQSRLKKANALP